MPTDYIKLIYDSEGFKQAANEQLALGKAYETTAQKQEKFNAAQDKTTRSSDRLLTRMGKLSSFGRDLRQAGGFLGSDTLMALGNFADGLGDVAQSADAVVKQSGGLAKFAKILGGAGLIGLGGLAAGALTEAGRRPGETTQQLLGRTSPFFAGGMEAGGQTRAQLAAMGITLPNLGAQQPIMPSRFEIESAQITANNAIFDLKQLSAKNTPEQNRLLQG